MTTIFTAARVLSRYALDDIAARHYTWQNPLPLFLMMTYTTAL